MAQKIIFTATRIAELPASAPGRREVWHDQHTPGLQMRVSPSGVKTWSWYRRVRGGGPERITLGRWPRMSVEDARRHAGQLNALVTQGESPSEERQAIDAEMTFADLFDLYLERWARVRKKSWRDDESKFRLHLVPLHGKRLSSITRRDVADLHARIGKEHPSFANRLLALLSKLFNFGLESGILEMANPAKGIRYYREISRDRFLSGEELRRFFSALREEPPRVHLFFMICLLTGARKRNILSMRWEDLDFDRRVWKIQLTKNGLPITIPLVPQAVEELVGLRGQNPGEWVFPSARSKSGHLVDPLAAWQRILTRAGITDAHIHDLRRTMGSWQAMTGASLPVIGKSLGHQSQQTTAIYARLDLDPVREAMERAVDRMMGMIGPS
ncbi:MAG: tyrosine-type recombinase/integrase [Magnetococcales bacterium]|nr:tyrosine-type recombinase/integrase [Magnetococcales bacterium]